jgi:uncharacterized protein (DUF1499 family)
VSWFSWLTRNWADTSEPATGLAPLDLPWPPAEALGRVEAVVRALSRWRVVTVDADDLRLTAERTTRLWRFVDDVTLRLETTATGSRLHGRSQSRVGKGDFGQNRRNLREVFAAVGTG